MVSRVLTQLNNNMAITPGRKKAQRENVFHNIGVEGRKTGITLKQNTRDENGIETLDGMFSSPEKSPPKRVLRNGNVTTSSSAMNLQESSAPEPVEVLSTRRVLKSTNTFLPPPAARSPYKTNIGSSPRRQSVAPPSRSPERLKSESPRRAATEQPGETTTRSVNRRLDFSMGSVKPIAESQPSAKTRGAARQDIFASKPSFSPTPFKQQEIEDDGYLPAMGDDSIALVDNVYDLPAGSDNDDLPVDPEIFPQPQEKDTPVVTASVKAMKGPGRPRNSAQKQTDITPSIEGKRGRGRPSRASLQANYQPAAPVAVMQPSSSSSKKRKSIDRELEEALEEDDDYVLPAIDDAIESPVPTSAAYPRKNKKMPIHEDEPEEPLPPTKKQKKSTKGKAARTERMPAPTKKTTKKTSNREDSVASRSLSPSKRIPQQRSLTILRSETPAADTMQRTRSGRTVIQPLQHWMGERIERNYDGSLLEVIRASAAPASPRKQRSGSAAPRGGKKRGRKPGHRLDEIPEEEEDEGLEAEDWELEKQILRVPVKGWDNFRQETIEEEEEQDIAISSGAYEPRSVANGEFQYTKITSLSFFGSGLVDLPPGGQKREKYVRKMQMMFFVHKGKVEVMVNRMAFVISKGGFFHVPRGNTYSIRNETDYPAQLLFAQGCETEVLGDE